MAFGSTGRVVDLGADLVAIDKLARFAAVAVAGAAVGFVGVR
jgi:hypothetical protein